MSPFMRPYIHPPYQYGYPPLPGYYRNLPFKEEEGYVPSEGKGKSKGKHLPAKDSKQPNILPSPVIKAAATADSDFTVVMSNRKKAPYPSPSSESDSDSSVHPARMILQIKYLSKKRKKSVAQDVKDQFLKYGEHALSTFTEGGSIGKISGSTNCQ